jgi:TonB family protein
MTAILAGFRAAGCPARGSLRGRSGARGSGHDPAVELDGRAGCCRVRCCRTGARCGRGGHTGEVTGADLEVPNRGPASRAQRYPEEAQSRREQGVAQVFFSIDRQGRVLESRVVRSSGANALDEEALALLKRAEPFPPPPQELAGDHVDLTVPIRFNFTPPASSASTPQPASPAPTADRPIQVDSSLKYYDTIGTTSAAILASINSLGPLVDGKRRWAKTD